MIRRMRSMPPVEAEDETPPPTIAELLGTVARADLEPSEPEDQGPKVEPGAWEALGDSYLGGELWGFVEQRRMPGAFAWAMLRCDLRAAAREAGAFEEHRIPHIVRWMEAFMPGSCWGSDQAARTWLSPELSRAAMRRTG